MNFLPSIFSSFPIVGIFLAILIVVYWVHAFFIIYHLTRFGIGVRPKIFALIFFAGSMFLFMTVVVFYNQVDMSALSTSIDSNWFNWSPPDIKFIVPSL